jgi:hypothetical protein
MTGVIEKLIAYADSRTDLPPTGYRIRNIDWTLDLDSDGARITPYGQDDAVPTIRRSGTSPLPMLAIDTADYVLDVSGDSRSAERCRAFWGQIGAWAAGPNTHPAVAAALAYAHTSGAVVASEHTVLARERVAVRVAGVWLHRLPEAVAEWERILIDLKSAAGVGYCIGCRQYRRLAETLPNAIPAILVPGAEQEVQLTVLPLTERAGKGDGLPVCVSCGDRAALAAHSLLADDEHRMAMAGQSTATAAFGIGSPDADARAVALLGLLSGRP